MKKGNVYKYNNESLFLGVIFIGLMIYSFIRTFMRGKIELLDIAIFLVIISLAILLIKSIKNKQESYKELLEKGIKVPGTIISPIKEVNQISDYGEIDYYLRIKYLDPKTNQEVEFKTDILSVNPYKCLKSNKCNVYIFDDKVIAEDFEFTKKKEELFFKDEDIDEEFEKEKKKVAILGIIAFMVILALTVLCLLHI